MSEFNQTNHPKGGTKKVWDELNARWVNEPQRVPVMGGNTISDLARDAVEQSMTEKLSQECPRSTFTPIMDLVHFWLIPEEIVNVRKVFIPQHAVPGVSNGPTCIGLVIAVGPDCKNVKAGDEVLLNNVAKMVDHRGMVSGVVKENMLMGIVLEHERFTKRPMKVRPTIEELQAILDRESASFNDPGARWNNCQHCNWSGFLADDGKCAKCCKLPNAEIRADSREYLPQNDKREQTFGPCGHQGHANDCDCHERKMR